MLPDADVVARKDRGEGGFRGLWVVGNGWQLSDKMKIEGELHFLGVGSRLFADKQQGVVGQQVGGDAAQPVVVVMEVEQDGHFVGKSLCGQGVGSSVNFLVMG